MSVKLKAQTSDVLHRAGAGPPLHQYGTCEQFYGQYRESVPGNTSRAGVWWSAVYAGPPRELILRVAVNCHLKRGEGLGWGELGVRMEVEQRNLVKMQKTWILIVTVMKMANLCSYLGCKNPTAFQPGFSDMQIFSETYLYIFNSFLIN